MAEVSPPRPSTANATKPLQVPGSHANLDHLAIGPAGVFVIDSKRYRGRLWLGPDGMLWYAGYPLAQKLATVG
jgi:hypothetical protein